METASLPNGEQSLIWPTKSFTEGDVRRAGLYRPAPFFAICSFCRVLPLGPYLASGVHYWTGQRSAPKRCLAGNGPLLLPGFSRYSAAARCRLVDRTVYWFQIGRAHV